MPGVDGASAGVRDGAPAAPEQRLAELRVTLPAKTARRGHYAPTARSGRLLFVSGHLPDSAGEPLHMGKLGRDLTTEQGYEAARQAAINMLAGVRIALGDLNQVKSILKLLGMVNCTDDFTEQPQVIDGASDLLHEIFGETAMHARSAVGMVGLPRNNCVELEAVIELCDGAEAQT